MKNFTYLLTALWMIFLSACSPRIAPIYVDDSWREVHENISKIEKDFKSKNLKVHTHYQKDTILLLSYQQSLPVEMLYLFKQDSCYYQEINLFCGPCSDKLMNTILKDKYYKFKAVDKVNYISQKFPDIIMRLNTVAGKDDLVCNSISIRKIN